MRRPRSSNAWTAVFVVFCLAGVVATYGDYGITWDESVQKRYGDMVVDYFVSGFQDRAANEYIDMKYYGALFETWAAVIYRVLGTNPYETRHLLIGVVAVLTLVAVMWLGRLWPDPWVSALAGPMLLLLPRFYGHAFNNSKDIPFACGFAWAMLAIAWLVTRDTIRWRHVILTGLAIGLALSMRVGGMLLFAFLGAALVLRLVVRGAPRPGSFREAGWALGKAGVLVVIAWAVMVAGWPWAHQNLLLHPVEAFRVSTDFTAFKLIRFGGEVVSSQDLPRSYLPWYLLITTPLVTAGLGLVGLVTAVSDAWRNRNSPQVLPGLLAAMWLVFPVVYVVVTRPVIYDGIRHFLFVLPALALLAAVGAARLRALAAAASSRHAVTVALVALMLLPVRDLVALHPYQSSYFNILVGKVGRASTSYDVDYWASSYKEASAWINERARSNPDRQLRVYLAGNARCLACFFEYKRDNVAVQLIERGGIDGPLPPFVDYYVSTRRVGLDENFPEARVVHTIDRDGAVFTVIKGH